MEVTNETPFYKKCLRWIPQRHIVAIMSFLAILNVAMINNCLPLTITQMVSLPRLNETIYTIGDDLQSGQQHPQFELSCPMPAVDRQYNSSRYLKTSIVERYEWSEELQGMILGSFYIGYVLMHLPGALLAERIGGKFVIIVGLSCTAILTILTPMAIAVAQANALIGIRIIIGTCQGAMWPALSTIMSSWVPIKERGSLGALVFSGISCGNIMGNFAAGLLLDYYRNWHVVFYTFGVTGVIVAVTYFFLCTSNPSTHPFITEREKAYLQQEMGQLERDKNAPSTPWKAIFTSVPVIGLIIDLCFSNGLYFILMNGIPKYLNDVLHVSVRDNGIYSSVPWAVRLLVAFLSGFWADSLITNKRLSITNTRKLFVIIAAALDGTFILAAAFGGCNPLLIGFFFIISVGSRGFLTSSSLMNSMDLSPNYAGTLTALSNGIGSLTGIFVPVMVGSVTSNSLQSEWRAVFCIAASLHLLKAINFTLLGSGEIQPWNEAKRTPEQEIRELNELYDKEQNKENISKA